jgi:uncharacterized protein (TIGR02145 family)
LREKSAVMFYGTMKDQDSNVYKTVKIGTQVWMAENLRTTIYSDGTPIHNETDNKTFHTLTMGAYCNYNNEQANGDSFGHLYNWYAVSSCHKIAPEGWHVPTENDWAVLACYLGGNNVAGGKLKETGQCHWTGTNVQASDIYGFSAIPAGSRAEMGEFCFYGVAAYWWSATQFSDKSAILRGCDNNTCSLSVNSYNKEYGFSVRLIKD